MISDSTTIKQSKAAKQGSQRFSQSILNALTSHIAVLNRKGDIIAVNDSWRRFAENNDGTAISCGIGINYLEVCDSATGAWAEEAPVVAHGIREIIAGNQTEFSLEYPCHSPSQERWFEIRVTHFGGKRTKKLVVAHENISERKKHEKELQQMHEKLELHVKQRTAELEQANASLQTEIAERKQSEAETLIRTRQLETVAIIGQQALANVDIDSLMQNITDYVTTTMGVEKSSLLELLPDTKSLRFRSGTGWEIETTSLIIPNSNVSHAGYALSQDAPLIITDLNTETRFEPSAFLLEEGVKSGVTVVIGGGKTPFGTLGAYTAESRQFTRDDIYIMQNMAHVLSATLEQRRISSEIIQLNAHLQEINHELNIRNGQRQITMDALQEAAEVLRQAKAEADEAREYAETANRSKNEFLSRMSHELRTPLNAILGFGQILEDQELTALQQESVKYIIKGGRHLLNLINDVLDIARIEAGRFELSIESIALDDIIPEACALVRPLATEHNIQLQQKSLLSENCHVTADRRQLKQVLINLLSNAIKYNQPEGKVIVFWESVMEEKIRISVQDTGHGIAKEDLSKLFTPFERLDAANSDVEGTGLGLALSQRLLTAMDSELRAESTLGEGSTFFFELPSDTAPEDVIVNLSNATNNTRAENAFEKQYTILLIEDNSSNLRLIEMILTNRPEVTLYSAIQGSQGLDLARQHEPDMILLDLHLPDMSGQQILNQLKRSAITRDIPVVIVSADATPSRMQNLLDNGVTAYLTKPLNVGQFLQILDETLQRKNQASPKTLTEENAI